MLIAAAMAAHGMAAGPQMPRFRFENFTTANGLPNDHVFAVLVDGDRVWAGTDNGLAHRAVLSVALDSVPATYGPGPWAG